MADKIIDNSTKNEKDEHNSQPQNTSRENAALQTKLAEIKIQAQQKLKETRRKMKEADINTHQYFLLRQNEDFYVQTLKKAQDLENLAADKRPQQESSSAPRGENLNAGALIAHLNLKNPPHTEENPQTDARYIRALRGLNPKTPAGAHPADPRTQEKLRTESYGAEEPQTGQKIAGLRNGLTVEQMKMRQNLNQRPERQLSYKERQRIYEYTRSKDRAGRRRS